MPKYHSLKYAERLKLKACFKAECGMWCATNQAKPNPPNGNMKLVVVSVIRSNKPRFRKGLKFDHWLKDKTVVKPSTQATLPMSQHAVGRLNPKRSTNKATQGSTSEMDDVHAAKRSRIKNTGVI